MVARQGNVLRLAGADARARQKGLHPGLAFADARARVPLLRVAEHDGAGEAMLIDALCDWCDRYSPLVAEDPPHGIVLDITGAAHLFGGEAALLDEIGVRLADQGFSARMAVAGTARAARAVCRFGRGGIVPRGGETRAAASLPVEALEAPHAVLTALRRAGLKRIGDLAIRPRGPLATRFGPDLADGLARILGEIDRPIVPRRAPPLFACELRLADPIGLMEDVVAALRMLAADLCTQLDRHGMGGRRFEMGFFRADGRVTRVPVLAGQPLKQAGILERLMSLRLDALADPLDPGFGFDMIRLEAVAADPLTPGQAGLDGHLAAGADLAGLVDRLSARFGSGAVERLVPQDSHLPGRAERALPAIRDADAAAGSGGTWRGLVADGVPTRPLFLFRPAQEIEVMAEIPDGPPRRFFWRGAVFDVLKAEGPERIAPEWWRQAADAATRDYFRIEDAGGRRFFVFRDGLYEAGPVRWFMEGLFA